MGRGRAVAAFPGDLPASRPVHRRAGHHRRDRRGSARRARLRVRRASRQADGDRRPRRRRPAPRRPDPAGGPRRRRRRLRRRQAAGPAGRRRRRARPGEVRPGAGRAGRRVPASTATRGGTPTRTPPTSGSGSRACRTCRRARTRCSGPGRRCWTSGRRPPSCVPSWPGSGWWCGTTRSASTSVPGPRGDDAGRRGSGAGAPVRGGPARRRGGAGLGLGRGRRRARRRALGRAGGAAARLPGADRARARRHGPVAAPGRAADPRPARPGAPLRGAPGRHGDPRRPDRGGRRLPDRAAHQRGRRDPVRPPGRRRRCCWATSSTSPRAPAPRRRPAPRTPRACAVSPARSTRGWPRVSTPGCRDRTSRHPPRSGRCACSARTWSACPPCTKRPPRTRPGRTCSASRWCPTSPPGCRPRRCPRDEVLAAGRAALPRLTALLAGVLDRLDGP